MDKDSVNSSPFCAFKWHFMKPGQYKCLGIGRPSPLQYLSIVNGCTKVKRMLSLRIKYKKKVPEKDCFFSVGVGRKRRRYGLFYLCPLPKKNLVLRYAKGNDYGNTVRGFLCTKRVERSKKKQDPPKLGE